MKDDILALVFKIGIFAIAIWAVIHLQGCTMDGELGEASKGKIGDCVDLRDGEKFSYAHDDVYNIRIGFGGAETSFEVVDFNGKHWVLKPSMEAYIKCEVRSG